MTNPHSKDEVQRGQGTCPSSHRKGQSCDLKSWALPSAPWDKPLPQVTGSHTKLLHTIQDEYLFLLLKVAELRPGGREEGRGWGVNTLCPGARLLPPSSPPLILLLQ